MSVPASITPDRAARPLPDRWPGLHRAHREAVEELASLAARVLADRWSQPMAEGKWTPAELTLHLALTAEVLLRELTTGVGPRVITKGWQRALFRFTIRPRLLAGAPFPRVRSPREARPDGQGAEQQAAISRLRLRAAELESAIDAAARERPRTKVTHPYLGAFSLEEGLRFAALHVRHHQRQLAAAMDRARPDAL